MTDLELQANQDEHLVELYDDFLYIYTSLGIDNSPYLFIKIK